MSFSLYATLASRYEGGNTLLQIAAMKGLLTITLCKQNAEYLHIFTSMK